MSILHLLFTYTEWYRSGHNGHDSKELTESESRKPQKPDVMRVSGVCKV